MRARDFFVINRWQKLFALFLAVLIWLAVRSGVTLTPAADDVGHEPRRFDQLPITVLTTSTDLGRYRLEPEFVSVILRGDATLLEKIKPSQIEVFVNLTEDSPMGTRPIHVYPPEGTELVSLQPREVLVDRLLAAEPNSVRK